ncbi:RICIN domain-containing protein [Phytomonospora sp. NPDC050363]|uniref:RICIN domain-containing protein n=1 Tax=Phytomonospora sp. NPDC050363 TaxID=3155642 RepID=UPI0033D7A688
MSSPKFPAGGTYDIKPAHTGLCLGIGPEIGNEGRTVLVQDSCSQAKPSLTVVKAGEDLVRFTLYFAAEDWSACIGADSPGELYAAQDCNGGSLQTFKLVPAGSGRYLIKSAANGTCMDFPWYRGTEGAQVGGASCSSGSSSQRFAFS